MHAHVGVHCTRARPRPMQPLSARRLTWSPSSRTCCAATRIAAGRQGSRGGGQGWVMAAAPAMRCVSRLLRDGVARAGASHLQGGRRRHPSPASRVRQGPHCTPGHAVAAAGAGALLLASTARGGRASTATATVSRRLHGAACASATPSPPARAAAGVPGHASGLGRRAHLVHQWLGGCQEDGDLAAALEVGQPPAEHFGRDERLATPCRRAHPRDRQGVVRRGAACWPRGPSWAACVRHSGARRRARQLKRRARQDRPPRGVSSAARAAPRARADGRHTCVQRHQHVAVLAQRHQLLLVGVGTVRAGVRGHLPPGWWHGCVDRSFPGSAPCPGPWVAPADRAKVRPCF